jgi:hypothetical protein
LTTPPPARPWQPGGPSTQKLDNDYKTRTAALDAKHRDEDAHPRDGETPAARGARHDAERRDLDTEYQRARTSGASTLPPERDHPQR